MLPRSSKGKPALTGQLRLRRRVAAGHLRGQHLRTVDRQTGLMDSAVAPRRGCPSVADTLDRLGYRAWANLARGGEAAI